MKEAEYLWETTAQGKAKLARLNAEARELAKVLASVDPYDAVGEVIAEEYFSICEAARGIQAGLDLAVAPGKWSF